MHTGCSQRLSGSRFDELAAVCLTFLDACCRADDGADDSGEDSGEDAEDSDDDEEAEDGGGGGGGGSKPAQKAARTARAARRASTLAIALRTHAADIRALLSMALTYFTCPNGCPPAGEEAEREGGVSQRTYLVSALASHRVWREGAFWLAALRCMLLRAAFVFSLKHARPQACAPSLYTTSTTSPIEPLLHASF